MYIGPDNLAARERVCKAIHALSDAKAWTVDIKPYKKARSNPQNAYLHGVVLKLICDHTGHDIEDMKTYLLAQVFGWVTYEILGEKRKRPMTRTHELNTAEFSAFCEWIQAWAMRELGVLIPDPNE